MRATAFTPFRSLHRRGGSGFTIIELAVTMLVIALLLGSILVPLNTQVESRKYDETQRTLERAREALIGFAAANGYFPCPAADSSTGVESTTDPTHVAGTCSSVTGPSIYVGFLPAATLGFTPVDSKGYALDAWGLEQNRIRYAVSAVLSQGRPFTTKNGMKTFGMSNIMSATNLLYVCGGGANVNGGTDCGTEVTLASSVPVVIWSVGPNAATTGGASVDEKQNPNPDPTGAVPSKDRIFVSKTKSGAPGDANEFDDIVTWIGAPAIFNRLIAAGQLP